MELTENQILFPLSHPIKKQLDLSIAEKLDAEISYNDSVKIADFFTNKREVDHFINSFKFSLKLMNNENKNHYFNIQCYYVYKLLTYKFDWIDSYLSILYDQGLLPFSTNLDPKENSPKPESLMTQLLTEDQETNLKDFLNKNNIKIDDIDFKICIDCLIFLFKSIHKFGFSDGAMYRMYYNDNVLGDISYSSLIEFIYAQIERNEAINFMHFFENFEEKHFIENKKYYYGTTNLKILNELVNFCFDFTSIPDKYYMSFLNGLNELKKEYSSVPFENNLNQKLIISCINFYKLNNSLKQYLDLYSFICNNISPDLNFKKDKETYLECIQFLNLGLNSSFDSIKNRLVDDEFNVFHKILSDYNRKERTTTLDLDNNKIEEIIVEIIENGNMKLRDKYSLIFNTTNLINSEGITNYYLPPKIQEIAKSFIINNINELLSNLNPNDELIYIEDNDKYISDLFLFKILKKRDLFSFEITDHTELLVSSDIGKLHKPERSYKLYKDYLDFLILLEPNISMENKRRFDYIKKIIVDEIAFNQGKEKFETKYYLINDFNKLRKDSGLFEFVSLATN
ncbi:MAG: hypothetical protein JNL75_01435 [Chitinophagales bacterium]|nr:hypothetical protein [Chitinophagales bacterium]